MKKIRFTRDETRARILDKAHALFRQFGYSKTAVADVARELKMSPANIYKFFPSKNALMEASADRNLCLIKKELTQVFEANKKAGDRLMGMMLCLYHFHQNTFRNEHQVYKLVITANEENWACVRIFKEFLTATLTTIIDDGIRSGEFRRTKVPGVTEVLVDCFTWIISPLLFKEIDPDKVENRLRAQVQLLEKALS